jgi:hypothetical protein
LGINDSTEARSVGSSPSREAAWRRTSSFAAVLRWRIVHGDGSSTSVHTAVSGTELEPATHSAATAREQQDLESATDTSSYIDSIARFALHLGISREGVHNDETLP